MSTRIVAGFVTGRLSTVCDCTITGHELCAVATHAAPAVARSDVHIRGGWIATRMTHAQAGMSSRLSRREFRQDLAGLC
jgi:hypothetical protein